MEQTPLTNLMGVTMEKIKEMVDVNTIIGNPITTPDGITIIPVSKVTFGFVSGGGGGDEEKANGFGGGSGAGVKIMPIGFLVCKDSNVRMLNIAPPAGTTVDRLVELIPEIIDKVEEFIDKHKNDE